jgi:hypothetical protein
MKKLVLSLAFLGLATLSLLAQTRYVDDVHTNSDIQIEKDIEYAQNYTVLYGDIDTTKPGPQFLLESLKCDFYYPPYDQAIGNRPVVIMMHTGNFLPRYMNNGPVGYKDDSATVELCKAFARKGYVVMAPTYRMGWNPIASTEDVRRETIINAAYKGVQDLSAAIRFLKDEAFVLGNFNALDTNKIAIGGHGTGSYITSAFANLDRQAEIVIDKFRRSDNGNVMVNDQIWGDRKGFGGLAGFNNENWKGYKTAAQVAFQVGGALGDSSWIDKGDMPMIWAHSVLDPFAPYKTNIVSVPGTPLQVVEASGGYDVIKSASRQGNNKVYEGKVLDKYTLAIYKYNEGMDGLYPMHGAANASGPYEWYDTTTIKKLPLPPTTLQNILGGIRLSNPLHGKAKAMKYIDTLVGYFAPRIAVSLGLVTSVGIDNMNMGSNVAIGPNPATDNVTVFNNWENNALRNIEIRNLNGQLVKSVPFSGKQQTIELALPTGLYIMNMEFERGTGSKKFLVN